MRKKYDNKYIDEKLVGRSIQRLSDCVGAHYKGNWKCLKKDCGYIWKTTVVKIILGEQGCCKCAGLLKRTPAQIDKILIKQNIKRLDSFKSSQDIINFECLICKLSWKSKVGAACNLKGCPKCRKNARLSNQIIDERLVVRNIKRLDDYSNAKTKIHFQCLRENCSYIWKANTDNMFSNNRGCPKCGGNIPFGNNFVDQKLLKEERDIKRIGEYKNSHTKIAWQCLKEKCQYIWEAEPGEILTKKTGCPICHYKNQSIVYAALKSFEIVFESQKDIRSLNNKENRRCYIDFYIPKYNLCIEYNGAQHYEPIIFHSKGTREEAEANFEKQKDRDQYVRDFCKNNQLKLIEIDGRVFKKNKLNKYVCELIKKESELLKFEEK